MSEVKRGITSFLATVVIQDSSSTTGAGLTGLTAATAGLKAAYRAQGAAGGFTSFSLVTGTRGTWSSGGFVEVDATNAPGVYELGIPNAAMASAGAYLDVFLSGATNMAQRPLKIDLVAFDPQDAVRQGLTAIPNVAQGTTGALPIGDATGRVTVGTNADKTGYALTQAFPANFAALAITGGGAVTAGTVSDKTGYSLTQAFPTNFSALAVTSGGAVTAGTVSDKTGYSLSQAFPTNFALLAIDGSGRTTVGTNGDKTGYSLTQTFPANFSSLSIASGTGYVTATNGGGGGFTLDSTLAGHTTAGTVGAALANADVATSTRAPSSGLPANFGALSISGSGFVTLTPAEHTAIQADATASLTAQGYTTARAPKLDNLDVAVSTRMATFSVPANFSSLAISGAGLVALTAAEHAAIAADTQTGLTAQGYTGARAIKLDNLDATVSSRQAAVSYPTNFGLLAIDSSGKVTTSQTFPTVSAIVNAIWDELKAGHTTAGSFGAAINYLATLAIDMDGAIPANNFASGLLDLADGVEAGITVRKFLRATGAVLAGVLSGAGTNTLAFDAIGNDGTQRVLVTVDSSGNRLTVSLTL